MKKVAFLITKSEVGGAQTWVAQLITLLERDIQPIIITNQPGWLSSASPNIPCYFVSEIEQGFSIKAVCKISRLLVDNQVDTVIASSANAGVYARLISLKYSFKCVYVSHGWSCIYNGGVLKSVYITLEHLLSKLSDIVWCVSHSDYVKARDIIKVPERKLKLAQNATFPLRVSKKTFLEEGRALRVVSVGRLCQPKRYELLMDAIHNLAEVELTIVGNGPDFNELSTWRSPNVELVGEVENFRDYADFDVFILLSDSEGLPMSAIEAGSANIPLILSDVGGCRELIEPSNPNGLLVENNIEEVRRALMEIKLNYPRYKTAANDLSEKFNIYSYKSEYLSILE
ncbi:glycosyltransferase [Vibrio orientalis]|uniref:glycosyltransferase n=1 Tax=Vibrio orientalis TaxID=28175 RepID=UPI001F468979|nr:glycosyltransferase [Vibrio orientalis]